MASGKEIKRKISSIKNTWKITKAMELISTVKMKKAQDLAVSKREFVLEMLKVFTRIEPFLNDMAFFKKPESKKTLWVVITSNKWLCWGYNINVFKEVNKYSKNTSNTIDYITLGKKAANFVARTWNNLLADFSETFTDNIESSFSRNISRMITDEFLTGEYENVVIFYNYFVNTITQTPVSREFLALDASAIKKYLLSVVEGHYDLDEELSENNISNYEIEPSIEDLAEHVIPMILDMMFFDILLEAKASEHSSRMIAMKNAKDNAKKIADDLTLVYNKARQAAITREVSEITAWVESMKDM
jgi:F-type H+-transporting ATPase subunit gamma